MLVRPTLLAMLNKW